MILKGVISSGNVDMQVEYAPKTSLSMLLKQMKDRTSKKLHQEFSKLQESCWGKYFWSKGYGDWSTENITGEIINEYLEHH